MSFRLVGVVEEKNRSLTVAALKGSSWRPYTPFLTDFRVMVQ